MSAAEDVKIPFTVVINRQNTKVLLAEVDSDFIDILLSFLTLPLGNILGLFKKHYGNEAPAIGSLSSLYRSLANLDDVHFWTKEGKKMLLNPKSTFSDDCRNLKYNLDDSETTKFFICESYYCNPATSKIIDIYHGNGGCICGRLLNEEILVDDISTVFSENDGVFTNRPSKYILSNDMQILDNALGSIVQKFCSLGITDVNGADQRTLHVSHNKIIDLLRGLLISRTPLTDIILDKRQKDCSLRACKYDASLHIDSKEITSRKMVVKIVLQKSCHKFLFAQAGDDFVDLLFSLLTIPLGGVAHFMGGNTCLGSVDNLYKSVANLDITCFKTEEIKARLLEPLLPCMYLSKSQILPIFEDVRKLYYYSHVYVGGKWKKYLRYHGSGDMIPVTINDPKGKGCYVRKSGMFMVTDDLVVTPLSGVSFVSFLNGLKICLSDVIEVEVEVGVEEVLNIMKASLTSTAVLTTAFSPVIKKQPKQEKVV